jgi:hypothetical protein
VNRLRQKGPVVAAGDNIDGAEGAALAIEVDPTAKRRAGLRVADRARQAARERQGDVEPAATDSSSKDDRLGIAEPAILVVTQAVSPTPLRAVKLIHTVIWAFFVACILAIPVCAARGRFGLGAAFAGAVAVEVMALAVNGMRCPLTDVAARYGKESSANFDIYLPEWLARRNKEVFGPAYVAGLVYLVARWLAAG